MNNGDYIGGRLCFTDMKNKIKELEENKNEWICKNCYIICY
jgi:hypothetical protein